MRRFVNHRTDSAKDTKAKQVTGDQTDVEEAVHKGNVNGHSMTARTCCRGNVAAPIARCAPNVKGDGDQPSWAVSSPGVSPSSPLPPPSLKPSAVQTPSAFSVSSPRTQG
jgi:hypothetical protein